MSSYSSFVKRIGFCSIVISSVFSAQSLFAQEAKNDKEINLYTTREPALVQPLLTAFTKVQGIKVNTVFVKDGLLERVKAEGERSPADVLMVADAGQLADLGNGGVTQSINSALLNAAVPVNLRAADNSWFALSLRARVIYAEKSLKLAGLSYEDLAKPEWRGKVCIRAGQHPYNVALIAAMIHHKGVEETEKWLRGVKSNLARKASGGDRDVARDILGGICDVGLANSYYVGHMKGSAVGSDARKWGDAIQVIMPKFAADSKGQSHGTHVNVSGAALAKHAKNKTGAIKLLEFLVSAPAQEIYAQANFEYPVRKGVPLGTAVNSFGNLQADKMPISEIAKYRKAASELVDKVGFDK